MRLKLILTLIISFILSSCVPKTTPVPTLATPDEATYTMVDNQQYKTFSLHLLNGYFKTLTMTFSTTSTEPLEYNVSSDASCNNTESQIEEGSLYFLHCTFKFGEGEDYQDVNFNIHGDILYSIALWNLKGNGSSYEYLEYP